FFFSSRRRHTRSKRDWSSDVCSSDLKVEYDGLSNSQPLRVDANNHTVTMLVQINGRFLTDDTRHGIVFKDGSNGHKSLFMGYARSEERRVGKECGIRLESLQ